MVMDQLEQLHRPHGEARKNEPPLNYIRGMLVMYKDVFTNVLLNKLLPKNGKQLCSMRDCVAIFASPLTHLTISISSKGYEC